MVVSNFEQGRRFEQSKKDQLFEILRANAMHIVKVDIATPEQDKTQATDYVIHVDVGCIAARVRSYSSTSAYRYRDWTIRTYNKGVTTEIDKLRSGYGDLYLYAWENESGRLAEWMLFDLHKVRESKLLDEDNLPPSIPNKDGYTHFTAISAKTLIDAGCMISHSIDGLPGKQIDRKLIVNNLQTISEAMNAIKKTGLLQ